MFDIGLQEMLLIGVIALLVFGPTKLPELGRMVGRAMREFRRASDEFRSTVETNLQMNEIDPPPPAYTIPSETPPESVTETSTVPAVLPSEAESSAGGDLIATEPTEAIEPGEPYCARRGARLFHRRECSWVAAIPEIERVYVKSVADARDQGFANCPVCEPWEPA